MADVDFGISVCKLRSDVDSHFHSWSSDFHLHRRFAEHGKCDDWRSFCFNIPFRQLNSSEFIVLVLALKTENLFFCLKIAVLLYLAHLIVHAMWKVKIDPDTVAIPYLTSLGDFFGSSLLFGAFAFLRSIGYGYGEHNMVEVEALF